MLAFASRDTAIAPADPLPLFAFCRLAGGVIVDDVCGWGAREPFRVMCKQLAACIVAASPAAPAPDAGMLAAAASAVDAASASQGTASSGRLDGALERLAAALNASPSETHPMGSAGSGGDGPQGKRTVVLEALVAYLQAARLIASRGPPAAAPAATAGGGTGLQASCTLAVGVNVR